MTLLGLDFDNTLVCYDKLFHALAKEKNLIPASLPANKIAIRNYLRSINRDYEFTILQGEVYGAKIEKAEPSEGLIKALLVLRKMNIPMVIVSHKTRYPYKGPKYDLHESARKWLNKYNFFDNNLNFSPKDVYFENTRIEKAERIKKLCCSHFIDDLLDFLEELPPSIKRIHYEPNSIDFQVNDKLIQFNNWSSLCKLPIF